MYIYVYIYFTPTVLPSFCNELHFDTFAQEVTFDLT